MKLSLFALLLFTINCISVTNLKVDKESPKLEKENYYYLEEKLLDGRPYSFRNLMKQVSYYNDMLEIESGDSLKNKNYYKLHVKHLKEPGIWKSFLLYLSAMTFSIIPVETSTTVQYNIDKIENGKIEKSYKYEYELFFCMSLFSLNCTFFNEKKYTSGYFARSRLNEEINKPIAEAFTSQHKESQEKQE